MLVWWRHDVVYCYRQRTTGKYSSNVGGWKGGKLHVAGRDEHGTVSTSGGTR